MMDIYHDTNQFWYCKRDYLSRHTIDLIPFWGCLQRRRTALREDLMMKDIYFLWLLLKLFGMIDNLVEWMHRISLLRFVIHRDDYWMMFVVYMDLLLEEEYNWANNEDVLIHFEYQTIAVEYSYMLIDHWIVWANT